MALNYANYNFGQLVSQLQAIIKEKETWEDAYESTTGQVLIELFAYVAELLMFYTERRAQESYIGTARNKSSLINLVKLINYVPKRNVSSVGVLKFTVPSPHIKNIYIPKRTLCKTTGNIYYLTDEDVVLLAGNTEVEASAIQGVMVSNEFTSNGDINQLFPINDTKVENTNVLIYVDGEEWEIVSSFVESQSDSKHCIIETNLDSTISIKFGDGKFGKIPPNAVTILVMYIQSEGLAGNVYSLGAVNEIESVLYDADSVEVEDISVENTSKFLGGDDEEDIEEIREEAPKVFKTGDRNVSHEDYETNLENYPGVVSAKTWGEAEETNPDQNLFNLVRIALILADYEFPDTAFKTELCAFLATKAQLTVRYEFINPTIVDVIAIDEVKASRAYSLSDVNDNVEATLDAKFLLGTIRIGDSIRYSDVDELINSTAGVAHHYLELWLKQNIGTGNDSQTEFISTLYMKPVKQNTVKVYQGGLLVAVDDGAGNITSVVSEVISGTVNYTTGAITVQFTTPPVMSESIDIQYQQIPSSDEPKDLVVEKNQILRLIDKQLTVIYES